MHQFEILFILSRSASGDLIEPLSQMPVICPSEFREGIEEMIVPRHSRRRHETAHGKSIHKRVKEMLVFVSSCRRDFSISARGLLGSTLRRG
jgi:hypothetical protein